MGTAALPTLMELSYNSVITFVSSPRFQGCDSKKPQGSGAPGFSPLGTLAKSKYLAEGLKKKKKKILLEMCTRCSSLTRVSPWP